MLIKNFLARHTNYWTTLLVNIASIDSYFKGNLLVYHIWGDFVVDVLVIGAGPAGLSAALQLARSNRSVLVFDKGKQRTLYAHNYQNYLGFVDGISGKELLELGKKQAEKFGVRVIQAQADDIVQTGPESFVVEASGESYQGRRIVFATGVSDKMPNVPDIMKFMGISVFHCLDCEGYELINRRVAIFGADDAAADAALRILTFTKQVFICTHGEQIAIKQPYIQKLIENKIEILSSPIHSLQGAEHKLKMIDFEDGIKKEVDFGYTTSGSKPHNELALRLGVETIPNGHILVDRDMKTNLNYVYAAGDIVNLSQQVALAVAEGIRAAIMINKTLLAENQLVRK